METPERKKIEADINEDIDEDGELDVQWYPLSMFPPEIQKAWEELLAENPE